jgi:hypothetical protein
MIRLSRAFLVALSLAVFAASCGSPTAPTITTTTTTTTTTSTTSYTTVTETYTGTLVAGATDTYHFHATPGAMTATMTSLPSNLLPAIGFGLGTWDNTTSTCSLVVATAAAQQGTVLVGTASIESDFCVRVWDVNGFAAGYTQPYTVTVNHYAVATGS